MWDKILILDFPCQYKSNYKLTEDVTFATQIVLIKLYIKSISNDLTGKCFPYCKTGREQLNLVFFYRYHYVCKIHP